MAVNLFGFTIKRDKKPDLERQSLVTPTDDEGTSTVQAGGYYGTYVDIDASARNESELISRYREISKYPDCDTAVEEIVSEAISALDDEDPVTLNLDDLDLSDNLKDKINTEFENVKSMLDFNDKAHDIFRRWYVDGRCYYQKLVDPANMKKGIQELRYIDPRKIRKVREVKKERLDNGISVIKEIQEYYVFNDKGVQYSAGTTPTNNNAGIKVETDTIAFAPSGLIDLDRNTVLGHLHKAIKPVNQLKMMEDSLVIYRLSRAPERRIFYIDIGNLPKGKAEQYMKDIMARYRNKIVYDSSTGEIKDDRKFMNMLEDFWLPRKEGGRGTEITTLPGGENLGQIADIEYFQQKVYQALNIPTSRFENGSGFNFGRAAEINRDELKFAKFIDRLRKKFNALFDDLLETQLVLKGVIKEGEWHAFKEKIRYQYAKNQYFQEQKESENLRNRIDLLNQVEPYIGTYYSRDYVKRRILRLTNQEIKDINDEMNSELSDADGDGREDQDEPIQQASVVKQAALSREIT